jgi:hypothetical protein
MGKFKRTVTAVGATMALAMFAPFGAVASAVPFPDFIPPAADWLTTVNYYRAMAGVAPITEDPALSVGAVNHSCYMLYNGISHDEIPGRPGYTVDGDAAGNSGNVAVSSLEGTSARSHVELWMTGPFHAIGVLRHNLVTAGFGKCDLANTPLWHSGATMNVLSGLSGAPRPSQPTLFPGDGTTTNLDRFIAESPNPVTMCGWSGGAGLPIIAMLPTPAVSPTATLTGPNGPIDVCVLSAANTTGVAQSILSGDNAVVVVPRVTLPQGQQHVRLVSGGQVIEWSFTVDQTAAIGVSPAANAQPTGAQAGLQPMPPVRLIDTRFNLGTSRLIRGIPRRVTVAGRVGVPTGSQAVLANVTATNPAGAGFLTVWNCSATMPVVSTLNFAAGATVPNAATIPLDGSGAMCVFSNVDTDLIVDINGYYSTSALGHYAPLNPTRVLDSRSGVGTPDRLVAGATVELPLAGVAGVPADASAVAINVTSINPSADGFVTAYPCSSDRPVASNLNPQVGRVRPNLVVAPLSSSGSICLFTYTEVDLVVDVLGYVSDHVPARLTASTPFRFTDTRDLYRPEVNAGKAGSRLMAGQTLVVQLAGQRGIPADAKAISANITVVDAAGSGFLTAWPCGERPTASNLNFEAGSAVANAAKLPLSSSGAICIYVNTATQVIIDVNGWWS